MSDDLFDRLDKYMSYKGLNDNQVTVQAGLSIGSLGKQRKGARGLASDSIAKLLRSYTDLDGHWLLTGRGSMLLDDTTKLNSTADDSELREDIINKLCNLIEENLLLKQEIEALKKNETKPYQIDKGTTSIAAQPKLRGYEKK